MQLFANWNQSRRVNTNTKRVTSNPYQNIAKQNTQQQFRATFAARCKIISEALEEVECPKWHETMMAKQHAYWKLIPEFLWIYSKQWISWAKWKC